MSVGKVMRVRVKNQYGHDRVFPVCPVALLFARLIGQKTFTHHDLCVIEDLGYSIEQVQDPLPSLTSNQRGNP